MSASQHAELARHPAESAAAAASSDASAWESFATARSLEQFYASWLAILCQQIDRVTGALILVRTEDGSAYLPGAVWPDPTRDMAFLAPTAERALAERRGVVSACDATSPASGLHVAYPIEVQGTLLAAVVLDLAPRPDGELQRAIHLIHWGAAWLIDLFRQRLFEERQATIDRLALVADLVATATQERRFQAAALAVANELAGRLGCDRVSLGSERGGNARVEAISHSATFDPKSALARCIAEAMDETLDLGAVIAWPAAQDEALAAAAHAALVRETRGTAVVSAPLTAQGRDWGVLVLERMRGPPFDAATIELVRAAGLLLGPVLQLRRDNDRGIVRRARDASMDGLRAILGPRYPGLKLLGALALAVLFVASVATGEHRVTAKTVIEGEVQRAIVAPFEGYVAESLVRAGDVVKAGQLLVQLDDRDLRLEQLKWEAEREQHLRKHRQALAAGERAKMSVLAAQVNQAEAQLQLVAEKLTRAAIVSPFEGIVVSGDLSQLLGSPVEQGKVLFEVAPLDAYRVILKVDERDVDYVHAGQSGELVLSGIPGERLRFTVARVTPVSSAEDGHNYFRAEARLERATERLRPGMEGVSKISAGEARLVRIWTRRLVDWLRLSFWTWMP